jgi:hypothetical protein
MVLLNGAFYLILGYMLTYMSGQLGHSISKGKWMLVAVMALMLLAIPPVADGLGRTGKERRGEAIPADRNDEEPAGAGLVHGNCRCHRPGEHPVHAGV